MLRIFSFIASFVAACTSLPAQTIHDVITSLSDRQRILVQREQVRAQLSNEYTNAAAQVPDDSPINWVGVGSNPSESAINAHGVAVRVALVNQAVAEFDRIVTSYANVSVGELEGTGPAGTIDFFRAGDFPSLPRATPQNHQEILRQLAQRIRGLRVVLWPSAFERTNFTGSGHAREDIRYGENDNPMKVIDEGGLSPFTWQPSTLGASNIDGEESATRFQISESDTSAMTVSGTYYEDPSFDEKIPGPLKKQDVSFSIKYPKRAVVRATAQGAQGRQIGGTVRILSRSRWHQLSVADAPARFNPANGSFVIEGGGASGDVGLFSSTPGTSISCSWVATASGETEDGPWLVKKFVETGYQLKAASMLNPSASGYSDAYHRAYEKNWSVGCQFYSLFQPNFTRGLDTPAAKFKLDLVNQVLVENTIDGGFELNPRPSLLFGIDLGPGLNGAGSGMLSAGSMPDALENEYGMSSTGSTYGIVNEISPVRRFDSAYALRLAGSVNDYHVVYENNRTTRTQSLPQLAWPYQSAWPYAPGGTVYDQETLYRDWDRPRLKQVVGRDLIANITYNSSHYGGYTITVYRRTENASVPVAGQVVGIDNLPVVRTWTFTKPGAGTTAHPTDPEKLQANGNANENFEISAIHHLPNNGAGWDSWYDYTYALWGGAPWTTAWWWYFDGNYKWVLKLSQGQQEKWRKEIGIDTTNLSPVPWIYDFEYAAKVSTFLDSQLVGELASDTLDPFGDASPSDWSYAAAGKTIVGTPVPADVDDPAFRYGKLAETLDIDFDGLKPALHAEWNEHGMLAALTAGAWVTSGAADGTAWKITRKFNNQTIATDWFDFTGPASLKQYSATTGASVTKDGSSVATAELEMGTLSTGMPGLPHKLSRSDGTGATFAWTIAADGSGSLVTTEGLLSGGSISRGSEVTTNWNARGFTTASSENLLLGDTLKTAGAAVPAGEFTAWGMPKKWKDDFSTIATAWTFDGNRSRTTSVTSPLGLTTGLSNFDVLDRPSEVVANGISATYNFSSLNTTTAYSGNDIQQGTESEVTRDSFGRLLSSNITWNGVSDNATITHNANSTELTRNNLLGEHKQTVRNEDGTVAETSGPTMAFGGTKGNALSVANGLLVTKTEITDAPGTYQETHTDAWGRIHKIITPQKSGNTPAETTFTYSLPGSALQRVITTEPTGKITIEESDPYHAGGAITRSGIDIDGNGALGAADRYTQSITTVADGKVVTTLSITEDSGMREVLKSEWTPSSGVNVTKINGSEETITSTPNHTAKTITTTSSKGWTRTTGVNNLGLAATNTLSGTGVPTTSLTPTWRADGSLAAINFTQGGETHTANFNPNGTLTSLTAPGRGNILAEHTISNGTETLTIDGKTTQTSLNGTSQTISGSNIIARTQSLATTNDGYQQTITAATGAATETHYNHALAQTKKKYADQSQQTTTYAGELPKTSSLARGGQVDYTFTTDGARDLSAINWPQVESGPFEIPAFSHAFTYNRSGAIKTFTDPSGFRTFAYTNGRPSATAYSAGILKGYQILTATDTSGRHIGTELKRDGASLHTIVLAPNAASDQINDLASGGLTATPQRDGAGRITGYHWSDGTNSVTQTWTRGIAGRIEFAGSNVPAAPSFDYLIDPQNPAQSFDAQNRRLKCQTAGGTWTYQYDASGQLTSAVHDTLHTAHSTLATFQYQFDGIGRRTDKGAANTSDLLNRTIAWTNSQNKTLTLTAHPSARVWFNGTEIQNFTGTHQATLTTTNPAGEWKPWNTLAILEGAGEGAGSPPANPLASPDAKAVKKGSVWLPPANETLTYDAAGNRQSNAQWDYGWDAKNQLVRARTKNHTTAQHAYDLTYTYDAEGRRVKKHVLEYQNGAVISEKIITFVWDDWDLLYERHQLPSGLTLLERKYLWGPDIADGEAGLPAKASATAGGAGGLLLISETKGNSTQNIIPLYDGTGHVIALTDIEKNLLASYAYGPFGEKISASGPKANTNPWRWATKYLDEETGLYYFGQRYYDSITGQWLSREPLGEEESLNLYSYCHNDPVNKVDVQGLEERVIADAEPKLFITGNIADGYYIGWATEKDGMFQAFKPTGNFYYQGPFTESQAREIQTNAGRLSLKRKSATLAFQSEQLQDSIHRLEVAKFYVANTAQAAAGVGEAVAGVLAEPVTFGVSTVAVAHGADVTSTALIRMWNGPGIDTQSNTSLAFQAIGFERNTAEYGDTAMSFVVPVAQVTNLVMKAPVSLSHSYVQTTARSPSLVNSPNLIPLKNNSVRQLLKSRGLSQQTARNLVDSFDGQIYVSRGRVGDQFLVVESAHGTASGIFVTRGSAGVTPALRIQNLALPPSSTASVETSVQLTRPQWLIEGKVAPMLHWGPDRLGGGWQVITNGGRRGGAIK
ncbi:MAG: hypothetical protein RIS79_1813 [Verrucomicrobiota bacterium]|jgi:RHS repeat-associated protein